jgi:ribosome biogenesis GTPase
MPEGRIIKALSGYYYVLDQGVLWQCRARGLFKKKGISPLVGDWVDYDQERNQEGYVTHVHPRSTQLVRPPIANVDQAVLVFSLAEPGLSLQLLDRFLVHTESSGVDPIICLSKADLVDHDDQEAKKLYEQMGYKVVVTDKDNMDVVGTLYDLLTGRISVFAGQSGVGKSTLLNLLLPKAHLITGLVSERLGRGKHTTRHVELLPIGDGWVADTPGFSNLDFFDIDEPHQLSQYFIDMRRYIPDCKFRGCLHTGEPQCAVQKALDKGEIAPSRYHHYKIFLDELKDKKRRY